MRALLSGGSGGDGGGCDGGHRRALEQTATSDTIAAAVSGEGSRAGAVSMNDTHSRADLGPMETATEAPAGPDLGLTPFQSPKVGCHGLTILLSGYTYCPQAISMSDLIESQLDNSEYGNTISQPLQWSINLPPSPSRILRGISTDFKVPDLNDSYFPNLPGTSCCSASQSDWNQWLSGMTDLTTDIQPASDAVLQDTTLCTAAFGLVMRCNKRNTSFGEIEKKLRCGYRSAVFQWEGCRVENRVLLAVLSEIS